jgi:hypothetical protein
MSTNAGAVVASLKLGFGEALLVAEPVLPLDEEELQPAVAKPIRPANTTARPRYRLCIRPC